MTWYTCWKNAQMIIKDVFQGPPKMFWIRWPGQKLRIRQLDRPPGDQTGLILSLIYIHSSHVKRAGLTQRPAARISESTGRNSPLSLPPQDPREKLGRGSFLSHPTYVSGWGFHKHATSGSNPVSTPPFSMRPGLEANRTTFEYHFENPIWSWFLVCLGWSNWHIWKLCWMICLSV